MNVAGRTFSELMKDKEVGTINNAPSRRGRTKITIFKVDRNIVEIWLKQGRKSCQKSCRQTWGHQ